MKRKLLYLTAIALFSATSINAQIKYIDLGGYTIQASGFQSLATVADINTACYPTAPKPGVADATNVMTQGTTPIVIGTTAPYQLTYINGSDSAGRIYSNVTGQTAYSSSVTTPTLGGEFGTKLGFIKPNGLGSTARRQFRVTVPAGQTVTCIIQSDAATPTLTYISTNNTTQTTFTDAAGGFTTGLTYAYKIQNTTAVDDTYTFWDGAGKIIFYRIYFADVTAPYTAATLGTNTFSKESDVTVSSKNNKIFFSNIKSKTSVTVYSISGALVKSADVNEDSGIEVENGVYIVKLQSSEGEKTVKVIVQ